MKRFFDSIFLNLVTEIGRTNEILKNGPDAFGSFSILWPSCRPLRKETSLRRKFFIVYIVAFVVGDGGGSTVAAAAAQNRKRMEEEDYESIV